MEVEGEAGKKELFSALSSSREDAKDDTDEETASLNSSQVALESTESRSNDQNDSDDSPDSDGDRLNQKGKLESSPSKMDMGKPQKKSKEPYCCPKQVLRLLADHDYCFRQEDWKLKKSLQADNLERIHLVIIVAEKYGKQILTGMGMGGNFRLAETCAAIDLCEQLGGNHNLVLPKSDINPDLRLSSGVLSALKTVCDMKKVSARWFKQTKGRAASGGFRTWNVVVGHLKIQGKGVTDEIAKQEAAYKMYTALTGDIFPLVEILKGQRCSGEFDRYDQTSNREFQMKNLKMPNRGLMPSGFRASIKAKAPSAPLVSEIDKALAVLPSEVEVEGLELSKLSGGVENNQSIATDIGTGTGACASAGTGAGAGAEQASSQAASTDEHVDQNGKVDVAEIISDVITPDTWTIVEVTDRDRDRHELPFRFQTNGAWQNCFLHTITSLVILGVVVAIMVAHYYATKK